MNRNYEVFGNALNLLQFAQQQHTYCQTFCVVYSSYSPTSTIAMIHHFLIKLKQFPSIFSVVKTLHCETTEASKQFIFPSAECEPGSVIVLVLIPAGTVMQDSQDTESRSIKNFYKQGSSLKWKMKRQTKEFFIADHTLMMNDDSGV